MLWKLPLQNAFGFSSISVSQLSRKNNKMNPAILSNLFLIAQARFCEGGGTQSTA